MRRFMILRRRVAGPGSHDGRPRASGLSTERLHQDLPCLRAAVDHTGSTSGHTRSARRPGELPLVGRDPPHMVALVGVEVDLRIRHRFRPVAVDGDDRRALHMGAPPPDQRLLTIALDHGRDGAGFLEVREVGLEHPRLVPQTAPAASLLPVSTAGPPLLTSRRTATSSSSTCRRRSRAANRSCASASGPTVRSAPPQFCAGVMVGEQTPRRRPAGDGAPRAPHSWPDRPP